MKGWIGSGKREDEKKTPEKIHIGSMARFMRPDAPSMVWARDAMSSPSDAKQSEESRQISSSSGREPRIGTPNTSTAKPSSSPTSRKSRVRRDKANEARYCQRDIGVAISRLSSRFLRASTMANPSPQMP